MTTLPFTNFTKGEIAPELQARIDTDQYGAGAKRVRNFLIQRYGGLSFRPGFRLVAEADSVDKSVKYIPFQFNIEQAYVMVLEDQSLRLMADGGFILEEDLKITAITHAVNAQLTVAYHSFIVGERIYLSGITGMTELNGRIVTVMSVGGTNTFTIDVDTTNFSAFVSSTGTVRSGAPTPVPAPTPPPAPTPTPDPPPTGGGGGTGGSGGGIPGWKGVDIL